MITWIAFAKTMGGKDSALRIPFVTEPEFLGRAHVTADHMAGLSETELMDLLKVSAQIACRTSEQYQMISRGEAEIRPALAAYTGAVFRRIAPSGFEKGDWLFAQDHLRIMSSLYGILRPLDGISAYRLEATASLDGQNTVAASWRPLLTESFISLVKDSGGVLLDLASEEMRLFLDWNAVMSSVRVVRPDFYERRSGRLKSVTMYAKMCRGEMVRHVVLNRIDSPEELAGFSWDGFSYDPSVSTGDHMVFVRG